MAPLSSRSARRRWVRGAVVALLALAVITCGTYLALRYQYRVLPWGPRTVELNHGRFALQLPPRWELTAHSGNEYRFADRTLSSGLIVSVAYRPRPASPEESRRLLSTAPGEAAFREVAPGRFYRTLPASRTYGGDTFDFTRHQLVVQDSRAIWYLVADWLRVPEPLYAPNTAADNDFFNAQIPQVRVRMKSNSEEKDEWATGSVELAKANEQLNTALSILGWTLLAFLVAWLCAYMVLERMLRLGKQGYTWVGQATTLISVIGILLAGVSFFSTKSDYRMQVAQVAADSELDKALTYYQEMGRDCRALSRSGRWQEVVTPSPESPPEMGTPIDCERIIPYVDAMLAHLLDAREHLIKAGDFVDPKYRLGLPISLFIGQAHQIAYKVADLSDEERSALADRCAYYLDPLDSVLRVVQSQADIIDTASRMTDVSKFWGVMLAVALALNMVKLTADRRFEREKKAADAADAARGAAPAPGPPERQAAHGTAAAAPAQKESGGMTGAGPALEPAARAPVPLGVATSDEVALQGGVTPDPEVARAATPAPPGTSGSSTSGDGLISKDS